MPAPTHFHQELANLRINVLEMAAHAEKALEKATTALLTRDAELAQDVINHDELINELECVIDEKSLRMLALEQPVAKDLRFIVGCMRTIVNLERIGDEAVNIAERALILSHRPALPFNHILEELSNLCLEMLRSSINAFKEEDPEMAQKVCLPALLQQLNFTSRSGMLRPACGVMTGACLKRSTASSPTT